MWASGRALQAENAAKDPNYLRAAASDRAGLHTVVELPCGGSHGVVAVIELHSAERRPAEPATLALLEDVGRQLGQSSLPPNPPAAPASNLTKPVESEVSVMSRNDRMREELDDRKLNSDRRVNQAKGEVDVSSLDDEDMADLRDEDITNINPDELDRLEAEMGITRGTGEGRRDLVPDRALHKDLEELEEAEERVPDRKREATRRREK